MEAPAWHTLTQPESCTRDTASLRNEFRGRSQSLVGCDDLSLDRFARSVYYRICGNEEEAQGADILKVYRKVLEWDEREQKA